MTIINKCPCCKGTATVHATAEPGKSKLLWIQCKDCGIQTQPYLTLEAAIGIWNFRKGENK